MDREKKEGNLIFNRGRKAVPIAFVLMELFIYIAFMYLDVSVKGSYALSAGLKFTGILLCFLFTLLLYSRRQAGMDIFLLRGALLFTVVSDLFLLILDYYFYGMVFFCVVQLLYMLRLNRWRKEQGRGIRIWILLVRNLLPALLIIGIFARLNSKPDGLLCVSAIYFTGIVLNTADAVLIQRRSRIKRQGLYAAGMMLFLLCDINVGLFNMGDFTVIRGSWFGRLYEFAAIAMWMFYLPAQVGISLSGIEIKIDNHKKEKKMRFWIF